MVKKGSQTVQVPPKRHKTLHQPSQYKPRSNSITSKRLSSIPWPRFISQTLSAVVLKITYPAKRFTNFLSKNIFLIFQNDELFCKKVCKIVMSFLYKKIYKK